MKPFYKSIGLCLDPSIQPEISDHVYVSELVLIINVHAWPTWDQIHLNSFACDLILISDWESEHQIFYVALIGPDHWQVFKKLLVEWPQIIERILLAYQSSKEEIGETGL